jgi:excisionase family DNA binding protein
MDKLLYTLREAAGLLSLSVRTLQYRIRDGQLRVRRCGRKILIPAGELSRFARTDHVGHHGAGRTQGADTNERAEPPGPKPEQTTVSATG